MALLRYGDHSPAELTRAAGCPSTAVLVARFAELAGKPRGDYRRREAAVACEAPVSPSSSNEEAPAWAPQLA